MSQSDYTIANQSYPDGRTDLNNNLAAIASQNSGATEPTVTFPFMTWADTDNDLYKQRNAADDAWIDLWVMSTGVPVGSSSIILGTPQATTSGTQKDFTGITSGTKEVRVMFNEVSQSSAGNINVILGDSGGFETSGYDNSSAAISVTTPDQISTSTSSFNINILSPADSFSGHIILTLVDASTHTWIASQAGKLSTATVGVGGGGKSLSGVLTQIRITSTGNFDGGSINIQTQ